jgi:uncharacterized protein YdeI (YjbR/CyaY-like superfamily)
MQILILLHYTANYANSGEKMFKPNAQVFNLTVEQKSWLKEMSKKILSMFERYSTLGKVYSDAIMLTLQRDINWVSPSREKENRATLIIFHDGFKNDGNIIFRSVGKLNYVRNYLKPLSIWIKC